MFTPLPSSFINTLFLFSLIFTTYVSSDAEGYTKCKPFSCGKFSNISYPFWRSGQPDYCGHPKFKLDCQKDNVVIDIMSQAFRVTHIDQTSKLLKIAKVDLLPDPCTIDYFNVTLDFDFFSYTPNDGSYTLLYDCFRDPYRWYSVNLEVSKSLSCLRDGGVQDAFFVLSTDAVKFKGLGCKNITFQVLREVVNVNDGWLVIDVFEFEVGWGGMDEDQCDRCKQYGERCGYDVSYSGGCVKSPAAPPVSRFPPIFPKYYAGSTLAPSMYSSFS
ncbi:hypothetical protein Fmac_030143 [Flemingia macrophylla]|uniref:Wall-associated receptor kinase galacturonan-binding domain-containing protein n=1 Tax=Flemingia macrophylla TaxID=520843 RepID=A0ABD1LCC9_9FABA